jgi:hypothetical protein
MSTHTPGPWTVYRCQFVDEYEAQPLLACGINGASFDASRDECHHVLTLADARLIAAAPELLEACKKAMEFFISESDFDSIKIPLEKAIAKAEGK